MCFAQADQQTFVIVTLRPVKVTIEDCGSQWRRNPGIVKTLALLHQGKKFTAILPADISQVDAVGICHALTITVHCRVCTPV